MYVWQFPSFLCVSYKLEATTKCLRFRFDCSRQELFIDAAVYFLWHYIRIYRMSYYICFCNFNISRFSWGQPGPLKNSSSAFYFMVLAPKKYFSTHGFIRVSQIVIFKFDYYVWIYLAGILFKNSFISYSVLESQNKYLTIFLYFSLFSKNI